MKSNTPEMVDLGLPSGTLWAKCNIGAKTETEPGKYFAWGDVEGFTESEISGNVFDGYFDWWHTKTWTGWYASQPGSNLNEDISDNDCKHNTAFVVYGEGYTIPSQADFQELIDETESEWTTMDGVKGWKFTNKNDSSKYIFMPAAGYSKNGSIYNVGVDGNYLSSTFDDSCSAYGLCFYHYGIIDVFSNHRYCGFTIRVIKRK